MAAKDSKSEKPKIMDAVHPPNSSPSPASGSRPVIVSNRSYIKNDPMLNVQKDTDTPAPVDEEKSEKPAAPTETKTVTKEEPKTPKLQLLREKKLQPISSEETDVKSTEDSEVVADQATPQAEEQPADTEPAQDTPKEAAEEVAKPATAEPAPELAPATSPDTPETLMADPTNAQLAPQPVAGEAEQQARDEEIERIITAGTYAVPLNRKKRRRTWIAWTIIGTILVIVAIVDILADIGLFTLPFGIPSTDFFVK